MTTKQNHIPEEALLDYLEGHHDTEVTAHLQQCQVCRQKLEEFDLLEKGLSGIASVVPPKSIEHHVAMAISEEQARQRPQSFQVWQIAAAVALLLVGYLLGNQKEQDVAALRAEIGELKEITMVSALQNYSPSQRLLAVSQIESAPQTSLSENVRQALFETLNTDASPNVRFAALQAIQKFPADEQVKQALVKSLAVQTDPMIQIALISYLVDLEEKSAIAPIKEILKNKPTAPEVQQQAQLALDILV